jgi:glutathione S-transferase
MKLYDCATAPSPRRVRIFAAEKGIQLDKIEVDLGSGQQFAPEFRALNPDCVVPVLELDNGETISEVLAICQYLEELHPDPALFGQTAEQRAISTMWNNKIEQHGLMHMRDAFRNSAKGMRGHAITGPQQVDQIPELAERGRQCVIAFFDRLEQQLDGRAFITGDEYSIADITGLVLIDFARWIKLEVPEEAVNLRRWHGDVSARPSARA